RPVVMAGDPHESSATLWAHNQLECGVWECTPGEFPFRRDGYDEVFCVLSGHATLHVGATEGAGQAFDLRAGSVILTPAGTTGLWVVHETIRKVYTIVRR
ncbi:MAG: cupin domain-containing protein, partial [Ilumatobacteraceae bacterium]|nr:cupin domain-containing protein [Ilumatobacteraceae bacterium]